MSLKCFLRYHEPTLDEFKRLAVPQISNEVTTLCLQEACNYCSNCVISCSRFDRIAHTRETMHTDGINSLSYKVVKVEKDKLFTKITVDVGKP